MTRLTGRLAIVALCAIVSASGVQAQSVGTADPYRDLSQYLLVNGKPVPASALAPIGPSGSGGIGNQATVSQTGGSNRTDVTQSGFGNTSAVVQLGDNNRSALTSEGTNNTLSTTQVGDNNAATLSMRGQDGALSATQVGSNLAVSVQQVGAGKPVSVTQARR